MSDRPSSARIAGVIALAILGISVSGPLARLAAAPPLTIAVWRLTLSLLILAVPLLSSGSWREWRQLSRRDLAIALGAGAFLAIHFWSWIASLGMTSVAASVLLVNLHPVVIVAGSALWLNERPTRGQLIGISVALVGAAIVALAGGEASNGGLGGATPEGTVLAEVRSRRAWPLPTQTLGNALAIVGAVTVGLYYLAGRSLRQELSLWPYVSLVYGACLAVLFTLAAATSTSLWPIERTDLGIFALIALGPMLAGHTGFNWALKYVPAFVVSLALLAEPVGAGLIAFVAMGETPSTATLVGGAVVLVGLSAASAGPWSRRPRPPQSASPRADGS